MAKIPLSLLKGFTFRSTQEKELTLTPKVPVAPASPPIAFLESSDYSEASSDVENQGLIFRDEPIRDDINTPSRSSSPSKNLRSNKTDLNSTANSYVLDDQAEECIIPESDF